MLIRVRSAGTPSTTGSANARLFLWYSFGLGVSWALTNLSFTLLLEAQGVSNTSIGYYNALVVAGTLLIGLPLGYASGRLGRRRVLLIAASSMPLAVVITAFGAPGPVKVIGAVLLGASESIYFTTGYPHMAENSAPDQRLRLYGRSAFLYYAGTFVGYLSSTGIGITGVVDLFGGQPGSVGSLRAVLCVSAGVAAINLIPLLLTGPPGASPVEPETGRSAGGTGRTQFAVIFLVAGVGTGALIPFLQLFLTQQFALSVGSVGGLLAVMQLATAVGALTAHRVARVSTPGGALVASQLLLIPFVIGIAYLNALPLVIMALVARGLLGDMQEPILNGHVMARTAAAARSTTATINQTVWLAGLMLGSIASGRLQDSSGWDAAFSLTVACSVGLVAGYAWIAKDHQR